MKNNYDNIFRRIEEKYLLTKNQYVKFKRTPLDTTKLEKIGWKPEISLKKGIENTVKYFN